MKIDVTRPTNEYMDIPFSELMGIVFAPGGDMKPCTKKARTALIARLKKVYPLGEFGNEKAGKLNVFDAYLVGCIIMRHNYDA